MRTYASLIVAIVGCLAFFGGNLPCTGQTRMIVKLYENPRVVDESFAKHWPSNLKGGGVQASYVCPALPDGRIGSEIVFRINRAYLVGSSQKRTVMQFEGSLLNPLPGESFVLVNTEATVKELSGGTKPRATLELPLNDGTLSEFLDRGFIVSEGAGFGDSENSLWIKEIKQGSKAADSVVANIEFSRGSNTKLEMAVGDTIKMQHFDLKVTGLHPPDKRSNRRGWMAVEPVFVEEVMLPE